MANTTISTRTLKANLIFADNDTRLISLNNPRPGIQNQVENVREKLNEFGAINIGDKTGAAFTSVRTAYIDEITTTTLDKI